MSLSVWVLTGSLSAGAIVAKVKAVESKVQDLSARVRMEITTGEKKKERVFDLALRREGVNYRAVISLREPPEMAGTRFLVLAERGKRNRNWAYFPDLDEVRPIASRSQDDPFLGSDLSYADLAGGAHLDDLLHRLLGEELVDGAPCYVMEGTPRHEVSYGKLLGWVRKDSFTTARARFFDRAGKPLKEVHLSELKESGGVPFAHRIVVESLVKDSRTVLVFDAVKTNQRLSEDAFTEAALAKR